jgi:hypothetical protein
VTERKADIKSERYRKLNCNSHYLVEITKGNLIYAYITIIITNLDLLFSIPNLLTVHCSI